MVLGNSLPSNWGENTYFLPMRLSNSLRDFKYNFLRLRLPNERIDVYNVGNNPITSQTKHQGLDISVG